MFGCYVLADIFYRYQALPGNADPEALPPLISQLIGEKTVGGA